MSRMLLILGLLLTGQARAAAPTSTLVEVTFVDAQLVTGAPELGSFPAQVDTVAQTAGGRCAKSEFVVWDTIPGRETRFREVLGSLGYTYTALNTSDAPGQHVVAFQARNTAGALAGIWADVDGTTLLGWCRVQLAPAASASKVPATQTSAAPTSFQPGQRVLVKSFSVTNEATVRAVQGGGYLVHYEDTNVPDGVVAASDVLPFNPGPTQGGPPPGTYQCWLPVYEHTYMGTFSLAQGTYAYQTGTRGSGRYRYDERSRVVTFQGGPLDGRTAEYTNTAQNGPVIQVIFPRGRRVGDVQNCLLRSAGN